METKTTNNKLLFLIAALLLFGSCRTNNENRLFRFEYEVADTTTQKEILLVLRMPERCSGESNKMKINIISPSGERYTDAFLFPSPGKNSSPPIPKDRFKVVKSGIWRDAGWVYKRGIRFPVPGKWYFNVYTENDDPRCVRELFLTVR